jgi:hypothetical protein
VTDRESASPTVEHCFRVGVALGSGISRPLRDWEPFKQPYALPVASTIGQYDDTHLYSRWSAERHMVHTCVCVCVCCTHVHSCIGLWVCMGGGEERIREDSGRTAITPLLLGRKELPSILCTVL